MPAPRKKSVRRKTASRSSRSSSLSESKKIQILKKVEDQNVKFMRLQFTDIFGITKNVEVPSSQFRHALDGGVMFDGSSIDGFARIEESDMYLRPDLDTFQVFPWLNNSGETVARLICDVYNPDGTPFALSLIHI